MRASSASRPMRRSGTAARSASLVSSRAVASTSTQVVASGISLLLRDSFSATARRSPRSGIRSGSWAEAAAAGAPWRGERAGGSGCGEGAGGSGCGVRPVMAAGLPGRGSAAGSRGSAMARSTSRRRMTRLGPLGVTPARSTPFSCASLRTSGEMTRGACPRPVPAAGTATGGTATPRRPVPAEPASTRAATGAASARAAVCDEAVPGRPRRRRRCPGRWPVP